MSMVRTGRVTTRDGVSIAFRVHDAGRPWAVVIAPGFFNSKDALLLKDLAVDFFKTYDVVAMDFRGHGESGGLFTWTAREHLDLAAVLDGLRDRYAHFAVIGFSMGAAATLITAARRQDISAIVAVSPPAVVGKVDYRFWELDPENDIVYTLFREGRLGKGVRPGPFWLDKAPSLEVVRQVKAPVLYIHGTGDWVVRPWHSQALFDNTVSEKRIEIIPNGPHAEYLLRAFREPFLRHVRDWLRRFGDHVPEART